MSRLDDVISLATTRRVRIAIHTTSDPSLEANSAGLHQAIDLWWEALKCRANATLSSAIR